ALHEQPDTGPLFAVDGDVDEGRDAHQIKASGGYVTPRDGDGLDRLVDGAGANRLDLDAPLASDHSRDRTGDRNRLGGGRNLKHLYWSALRCHCWNPFKRVRGRLAGSMWPGLWNH